MEPIDRILGYCKPEFREKLPSLLVICGASGVGKSALASRIAAEAPHALWVDADLLDAPSSGLVGNSADKLVAAYRLAAAEGGSQPVVFSGVVRPRDLEISGAHRNFRTVRV